MGGLGDLGNLGLRGGFRNGDGLWLGGCSGLRLGGDRGFCGCCCRFGFGGLGCGGLLGGGAAFGLEGEEALAVGVDVCEEEDGESAQFFVGGYGAGLHVGYHCHENGVGSGHVEAFEDFEPGGVEDEVAGHCHGFELFVVHSCDD